MTTEDYVYTILLCGYPELEDQWVRWASWQCSQGINKETKENLIRKVISLTIFGPDIQAPVFATVEDFVN